MKRIKLLCISGFIISISACQSDGQRDDNLISVGSGQMPSLLTTENKKIHLVYGSGDSILYVSSPDKGRTFSKPSLIAVLPDLVSSHTRGPQIASGSGRITVTACVGSGNIYAFSKGLDDNWSKRVRVNDIDTVAKEGLMALSGDGNRLFAVWLDLRNKHNQIYGSLSLDGGLTWTANQLIYASIDSTVCECCKPSVLVKRNNVNVMFRNWIDGNRDMYLIQSVNGGKTFMEARKLGMESWKLKGCPMDGGGLAIRGAGIQSFWRRGDKLFLCEPGKAEMVIATGKGGVMDSNNEKNVYSWIENGEVIFSTSDNERRVIGRGGSPAIKVIDENSFVVAWEQDKTIKAKVVNL
ncbi:MAG: exo-alpha-sialidase [Pedobacter sp.]|jgi:hypothetical protein|nr:MAG: exo-alpha-sialidase [Pedobacter sp.]